jgi:hypothetical protein
MAVEDHWLPGFNFKVDEWDAAHSRPRSRRSPPEVSGEFAVAGADAAEVLEAFLDEVSTANSTGCLT